MLDTALSMKDEQNAASMVDILMGGEANKILSFLRKSGMSYKEFMANQKKLNFLNKEGLEGAKEYSKVSAKTSSIVGSMFKQIAGVGGSFLTPILKDFNSWLVLNKEIVQLNIKSFFTGLKEGIGSVGEMFATVGSYIRPIISLFSSAKDEIDKAGESGLNLGKSLALLVGGFGALIGAKLIFGGLGMAIGVVTTAFRVLSIVASLNPIGLAITAIAGGAYLIYKNWEGIKTAISWSPIGLLVSKWQPVTDFFKNINLFDAGKKIIGSVVDGLSATWGKLTAKVGDITKSIRDFFPFSPAKKGALTDIHKIKLMETVANSIDGKPLLKAVNSTTKKVRKAIAIGGVGMAIGGSVASSSSIDIGATDRQNNSIVATPISININFGDVHIANQEEFQEFHSNIAKTVQNAIVKSQREAKNIRMYD